MTKASGSAPLLLDTHYWIWFQAGTQDEISDKALKAIEGAASDGRLLLSVISVWELGMLDAKGRIRLQRPCEEWVKEALATPGLELVPLTPEIALDSSRLPGAFYGDPADRIIVATARSRAARLLTRDKQLVEYGRLRHVSIF